MKRTERMLLAWRSGRSTSSSPASPSPTRELRWGKRHQARELALKTLFQLEAADDDPEEVLRYHAAEGAATPDVATFALQLVRGVIANREKLDAILSEASEHWKLGQMAKVDRIILRIAVYEIAIDRNVPTKAAINESIELAKTFSARKPAGSSTGSSAGLRPPRLEPGPTGCHSEARGDPDQPREGDRRARERHRPARRAGRRAPARRCASRRGAGEPRRAQAEGRRDCSKVRVGG